MLLVSREVRTSNDATVVTVLTVLTVVAGGGQGGGAQPGFCKTLLPASRRCDDTDGIHPAIRRSSRIAYRTNVCCDESTRGERRNDFSRRRDVDGTLMENFRFPSLAMNRAAERCVARTVYEVIVDHADRLHQGVADR